MKASSSSKSGITFSATATQHTPQRVLAFLNGAAKCQAARDALAGVGYTQADQEEGWALLRKFTVTPTPVPPPVVVEKSAAEVAMEELSEWCGPNFARARAVLGRRYPEQEAFIFSDLSAGKGAEGVLAVATFLARCEALEVGTGGGTPQENAAALQMLAARGITVAERTRLAKLVETVEEQPVLAAKVEPPVVEDDRQESLTALHLWLKEWSETARSVIKRRDVLMRLGLWRRKANSTPVPPAVGTLDTEVHAA